MKSPIILIILDGWGHRTSTLHNAITTAHTPNWDAWLTKYPNTLLAASGHAVGLPDGQMGNSEVGHMHIGSGRIIHQDLTIINQTILDGSFAQNPVLVKTVNDLATSGQTLHIAGLLSNGGVHSHEEHLLAFLTLAAQHDFARIKLHLFLDGRDTPPQSAADSIKRLEKFLQGTPVAQIASISGRYYAMDRDKRWERVKPVYDLIADGIAKQSFPDALSALNYYYDAQLTDEFIPPTIINHPEPLADGDAFFMFNFRNDRMRELTASLLNKDFTDFPRARQINFSHFISMTQYADYLPTEIVFPNKIINNTAGDIIAQHGMRQLRIAETEKYAHVTFFFNAGREQPLNGEDRILIPSPKVATYDLQPEMAAQAITDKIISAINENQYEVIICNFANADMVGHTGSLAATVAAIETLDTCLGSIWQALEPLGGAMLITADHGNAECMYDDNTRQPHTAHTSEPVPFLYLGDKFTLNKTSQNNGALTDIAPTLLTVLGLPIPQEMIGTSLLRAKN